MFSIHRLLPVLPYSLTISCVFLLQGSMVMLVRVGTLSFVGASFSAVRALGMMSNSTRFTCSFKRRQTFFFLCLTHFSPTRLYLSCILSLVCPYKFSRWYSPFLHLGQYVSISSVYRFWYRINRCNVSPSFLRIYTVALVVLGCLMEKLCIVVAQSPGISLFRCCWCHFDDWNGFGFAWYGIVLIQGDLFVDMVIVLEKYDLRFLVLFRTDVVLS